VAAEEPARFRAGHALVDRFLEFTRFASSPQVTARSR
jgi:hypothetical protein